MADVHGFCDERFRRLDEAFCANLERGLDKGASLAVTLHGELVVDRWGGTRDYEVSQPWEADTLVRVFSTSKVMVMITVLLLVDRGQLDLDEPIATHWPEFARHGKGRVTPRQVLLHRSGLPGYGRTIEFSEMADWDHMIALLEDAELWYEPGTISCYHPHNYGYLLGELVRRTTDTPFDEFFHTEIAEPVGADFHFGITPADLPRVAAIWPADRVPENGSEMGRKAMEELSTSAEWISRSGLGYVIPSAGGITNARAMARIGAMVACGGELDGRRYLGPEIVAEAGREQSWAEDELLGWLRLGLGFGLHSDGFPAPTPSTLHWGGYGGSFLTMDPAAGISCAFAPNQLMIGDQFGDDPRLTEYWRLLGEISAELT